MTTRDKICFAEPPLVVDTWVCRDTDGVLHVAKVDRYFDGHNKLVQIQGCTACRPSVSSCLAPAGDWSGAKLPPLTLGNQWGKDCITLVEYRIREAPTCVRCAVLARPL